MPSDTRPNRRSFIKAMGLAATAMGADAASGRGAKLNLGHWPKFTSGVPEYPTPFLAIARTPNLIAAPQGGGMNIESDVGFLSGFSGFVDKSTGRFGYPGYNNYTNANFSFDNDKLVIVAHVPYPVIGDLHKDDTFEVLIQPRGSHSTGFVYRVTGNAFGQWHADLDEPIIGQFHRPWHSLIHYGSMLWPPSGLYMASVAIPWKSLGGRPANGDVWGVQFALRYRDPTIVAYLSPTDKFTHTRRFARIRFDFNRRVNYRPHWLSEEMDTGHFMVQYLLANGGTKPATVEMKVALYKTGHEFAHAHLEKTAPPGSTYWADNTGTNMISLNSEPATPAQRDTVAHLTAYDRTKNALIYDQWVPYWQFKPGENDWIKQRLARQFSFNIGPYPSTGVIDYAVDARSLKEVTPTAVEFTCAVLADGKPVFHEHGPLPADGQITGSITLGSFTDRVTYDLQAQIRDSKGSVLNQRSRSFTRRVMPFEKAAPAGVGDDVFPPFTPPQIHGTAVSCLLRTYVHGTNGLLEELIAAERNLLIRPAIFTAVLDNWQSLVLTGGRPQLLPHGQGSVDYTQTFHGGGVELLLRGNLDYDGFYHFTATLSPQSRPVTIRELRLQIPLSPQHATLIDAAVTWMYPGWEKALGFLSTQHGRIWDSHTLPMQMNNRVSNMPPYIWIGDDDRGLCYSCASDEGTHNRPDRPAAALDRDNNAITLSIWMVNSTLHLEKPRSFQFALQASPFKPVAANGRLWRDQVTAGATYKNGLTFTDFWNPASYPTYGRWLTLDYLKKQVAIDGCDRTGLEASALSECAGTPEYRQFYYEWGSAMNEYQQVVMPVPSEILERFKASGVRSNPFVMVEAFSNTTKTNRDYRVWWLSEAVKHAGVSFVYQDNPTWVFADRPQPEYGYKRLNGGIEPTSMIWKSRDVLKRFFQAVAEAGQPSQPGIWPNMITPAAPGRSFCGKALDGEYTDSNNLRMGMMRVHLSKQWGFVVDWLCQAPSSAGAQIGTTRDYWRALFSQLCLLDVTNFSRSDSAEIYRLWWNALDIFWLDDPSIRWHPYYRNPTLAQVAPAETTLVSTYTATGRLLAIVSNRGDQHAITTVRFENLGAWGASGLAHFYDAETAEEIAFENGVLRLFVARKNYRLIIGFRGPWKFAAKNRLPHPNQIPTNSSLDPQATIGAICRHLLTARTLPPMPHADQLLLQWAQEILKELPASSPDIAYFDARAMADIHLGNPDVRCSVFVNRRGGFMLVGFYNGTDQHRVLSSQIYEQIAAKVGKPGYNYIYDAIGGQSEWSEIDLPAHSGRWEVAYQDNPDYYGARRGVFKIGTLMSNILEAIEENKKTLQ